MSEIKFCPQCGAPVQEGAKFCMSCGNKLEGDVSFLQPTTSEDIPTEAESDTTTYEVAAAKHKAAYTEPSTMQNINKESADVPPAAAFPKSQQNEMPAKNVSNGKTGSRIRPFLGVALLTVAAIWGISTMLHSKNSSAETMRESEPPAIEKNSQNKTEEDTSDSTALADEEVVEEMVVVASDLTGTIDDSYDITMEITYKNVETDDSPVVNDISGTYYYNRKGEDNKLHLRGNDFKDGTMVLYEFDSNGESTGKFEGKSTYEDSEDGTKYVFKGTFTTKDGKSMPFKLYYL